MRRDLKTEENTETGATGPPKQITVISPKYPARCRGCPYPRTGFICWSPDGSCLKTDMDEFGRSEKGG